MKKLLIAMLLALLATACGGSDEDTSSEVETSESVAETSGDSSGDDSASDGTDPGDASTVEITPPEPLQVTPIQTRDCAHEAVVDEGDDVELPPASKPAVDAEFLGEFDELITTDLIVGTGETATAGATVAMQYVGVLGADGTEFDASWNNGAPFTFQLGAGRVIAGWDQGIEGMQVGGRRVLQIPSALAYGEQARSEIIVENSDLVFVVDLIDIVGGASPDVDASYLGSFDELQITDVVVGEGCEAQIGDIVTMQYVGVNGDDGIEFDSSWSRGAGFDVIVGKSQVIDGWNAGIEGMRVGGQRVLQIPADQAYGDRDLVFLVELQRLIEAPLAHTLSFDGDAPKDIQVDTLVEGSGEGAAKGGFLDAQIVILDHETGKVIQSTYAEGAPAQLALQTGTLLPGLEENIAGIKAGETRQIILPISVAFPGGAPAESGMSEDDAFVFVVEALRVTNG